MSKVTRAGLLQERVYLEYSQERLASYGVKAGTLGQIHRLFRAPDGTIRLLGDMQSGTMNIGGTLDVSGTAAGQTGGNVTVTGHHVGLFGADTQVSTSGRPSPPLRVNYRGTRHRGISGVSRPRSRGCHARHRAGRR